MAKPFIQEDLHGIRLQIHYFWSHRQALVSPIPTLPRIMISQETGEPRRMRTSS
nr:hypothetical protein Iba_chr05eCG11950 [Ipomoea batatas]